MPELRELMDVVAQTLGADYEEADGVFRIKVAVLVGDTTRSHEVSVEVRPGAGDEMDQMVSINAIVGTYTTEMDLLFALHETAVLSFARFSLFHDDEEDSELMTVDGQLFLQGLTARSLEYVVQEVADLADKIEAEYLGDDDR